MTMIMMINQSIIYYFIVRQKVGQRAG